MHKHECPGKSPYTSSPVLPIESSRYIARRHLCVCLHAANAYTHTHTSLFNRQLTVCMYTQLLQMQTQHMHMDSWYLLLCLRFGCRYNDLQAEDLSTYVGVIFVMCMWLVISLQWFIKKWNAIYAFFQLFISTVP